MDCQQPESKRVSIEIPAGCFAVQKGDLLVVALSGSSANPMVAFQKASVATKSKIEMQNAM